MSVLCLALLVAVQAGLPAVALAQTDKDAGLHAFREGRYEDAVSLLERAVSREADYDSLVALGVARGRLGRLEPASQALERALRLEPERPEAWVERGGLRFVEARYLDAARDLERALRLRDDAYARELLASSLHLAGQPEDALDHWNRLGQPRLRSVDVKGLVHTRDHVVRQEIGFREGDVLLRSQVRAARLRLAELGIFDRITLRPVPRGDGTADLELALAERYGLFRSAAELAVSTGINALQRRVRLRYWNLGGAGISLGGQYRWETNRPALSLSMDWPRPLGLPFYLHVVGFRERQLYDLERDFTRRSRGVELGLRRVLGPRTVGELGWRLHTRSFREPAAELAQGTLAGAEVALERRLTESRHGRLDASARLFRAAGPFGSDLAFSRALLAVGGQRFLAQPEGKPIEASLVAARFQYGWSGEGMPIDESFAPGVSPEMEFPLRAHFQTRRGALGATPLGASLTIANLEWRQRLVDRTLFQLGFVLLYDGARVGRATTGRTEQLHDVGVGVRVRLGLAAVVRVDYAHGLTDGKNALTIGLGQAF